MIEKIYKSRDGADISVLYFAAKNSKAPLILEIHGGGYVGGHNRDDVPLCNRICAMTGCNVAAVEYRYAPRVAFPIAAYDCLDALNALAADEQLLFDRTRISVWGHSAGANAATALAQLYNGLSCMVLSYPWLDVTDRRRPYVMGGMPSFFVRHMAHKYFKQKDERALPLASPVYMSSSDLKKLPPVFIIACGKDTLRDDAYRFYSAMRSAGAEAKLNLYSKAEHGFIEVVSAGRIKDRPFSRRRFANQTLCYEEAMKDATAFFNSKHNA